jgi:hypothetical protein
MTNETFDLEQLDFFAQTEGLRLEDVCVDFSLLRFIDVESSGLGRGSYPIEYGSCGLDLQPVSLLIRRRDDFALADWSPTAQNLHNISLDDLADHGVDADEAARRISLDLAPGVIGLSDNPDHDFQWLIRLSSDLDAVGLYPISLFQRQARIAALERHGYERLSEATVRVQERYPHLHRAGPDSLRAAAQFRLLVDDKYVEEVLAL